MARNKNYITAREIIRNEMEYDRDKQEWISFPDNVRETAFKALKLFVAGTARGERRKRILQASPYNVSDWGILRRLWYHPDTGKVEYCCGQEWNSEMAVLRDAFDYKRR